MQNIVSAQHPTFRLPEFLGIDPRMRWVWTAQWLFFGSLPLVIVVLLAWQGRLSFFAPLGVIAIALMMGLYHSARYLRNFGYVVREDGL